MSFPALSGIIGKTLIDRYLKKTKEAEENRQSLINERNENLKQWVGSFREDLKEHRTESRALRYGLQRHADNMIEIEKKISGILIDTKKDRETLRDLLELVKGVAKLQMKEAAPAGFDEAGDGHFIPKKKKP